MGSHGSSLCSLSFQHVLFTSRNAVWSPLLSLLLVCHQGLLCLAMPAATVTAAPLCCLFLVPALSFSSNILHDPSVMKNKQTKKKISNSQEAGIFLVITKKSDHSLIYTDYFLWLGQKMWLFQSWFTLLTEVQNLNLSYCFPVWTMLGCVQSEELGSEVEVRGKKDQLFLLQK